MTPGGNLRLSCFHIVHLMTHLDIKKALFSLHFCYKPFKIPQRVTKSQKIHISSHNGLQNFLT